MCPNRVSAKENGDETKSQLRYRKNLRPAVVRPGGTFGRRRFLKAQKEIALR